MDLEVKCHCSWGKERFIFSFHFESVSAIGLICDLSPDNSPPPSHHHLLNKKKTESISLSRHIWGLPTYYKKDSITETLHSWVVSNRKAEEWAASYLHGSRTESDLTTLHHPGICSHTVVLWVADNRMVKHACWERERATLNAKEGPRIHIAANSFFEIPVTTKTFSSSPYFLQWRAVHLPFIIMQMQ